VFTTMSTHPSGFPGTVTTHRSLLRAMYYPTDARCRENDVIDLTRSRIIRRHSSRSSNGTESPTETATVAPVVSMGGSETEISPLPQKGGDKRRGGRKAPPANDVLRIGKGPTSPSSLLTRRQLLRLSPKQRSALLEARLRERRSSMSHLDAARHNARSNLRYLRDNGALNLRENIRTMKRLLFEDGRSAGGDESGGGRSSVASSATAAREGGGGIDWERAPSEVVSNVKRNITGLRNWIHVITDGAIPASSSSGGDVAGMGGGSVATRIRDFHERKQKADGALVMDNWWIGKNVAIALLPGLLIHLYFWSLQDEMREYYSRSERMERDKIMGNAVADDGTLDCGGGGGRRGGGMGDGTPSKVDVRNGGNTGIYSVLIPDGGNAWDKLRTVVEDVFLGGAEKRINELKVAQDRATDEKDASDLHTTPAAESSSGQGPDTSSGGGTIPVNSSTVDEETDIRVLLERVRALERQLGIGAGATSSPEEGARRHSAEELRKEHELKRKLERIRQSPIQNRREDSLEAKWRNEANGSKGLDRDVQVNDGDNPSEQSRVNYFINLTSMVVAGILNEIWTNLGLSNEALTIDEHNTEKNQSIDSSHSCTDDHTAIASDSKLISAGLPNVSSAIDITKSITENKIVPAVFSNVDEIYYSNDDTRLGGRIYNWAANMWRLLHKSLRPGEDRK
jgi:hypothetical protein